ncbi:hypothetical protein CRG98_042763 [Punica granatum]|uniref:Uncharacterized protein n=1 Tax=Punica granatum TaxID=22663 RepID=A0A2I0HYM5_PUNGR|nr:hypothetical protein CRG98_042763 [Punica granatum]
MGGAQPNLTRVIRSAPFLFTMCFPYIDNVGLSHLDRDQIRDPKRERVDEGGLKVRASQSRCGGLP